MNEPLFYYRFELALVGLFALVLFGFCFLWASGEWRKATAGVQRQINRVPGRCFVCGAPATGNYRLAKPTCAAHGRAFYDLLLAEGKRQTAERECRRKVVAVLAFSPNMRPEEVAKLTKRKLETVQLVMHQLEKANNGKAVGHGQQN